MIFLQIIIDCTYYRAQFYGNVLCTCLIKTPEPGEFIAFSNSAMLRELQMGRDDECTGVSCSVTPPRSWTPLFDRHECLL